MFDFMIGAETTAPALFDDQVIQDCLGRLLMIKKDMEVDSRPKKWAEQTRAGDKLAIYADLDTHYLQHETVLTVIKSKHQDLLDAVARANGVIVDQQGIIADLKKRLEESRDTYALAVIQDDANAMQAIEQDNAESTQQIKLSEIRIGANTDAIKKADLFLSTLSSVINYLESQDRIRAHQQAENAFKPLIDAFAAEYKSYIQQRRDIGHGYQTGFNESDIAKDLVSLLGYDLQKLVYRQY